MDPNRKNVVKALTIGLTALSFATSRWDDLVSHLSLGIAIGMAITTAIYSPRSTPKGNADQTISTTKTIAFWVMLLVVSVLIYQTFRGPTH